MWANKEWFVYVPETQSSFPTHDSEPDTFNEE